MNEANKPGDKLEQSKTPRADKEAWHFRRMTVGGTEAAIDFARQLERELAEAEAELERRQAKIMRLTPSAVETSSPLNADQTAYLKGMLAGAPGRARAEDEAMCASIERSLFGLTPSATTAASDEGYPGIAHDFETMRSVLEQVASYQMDCRCSVRERDSGHHVDCHVPEFQALQDIARNALLNLTARTDKA